MKISTIWHFNQAKLIWPYFRDGLRSALEIISEDHEVEWVLEDGSPRLDSDFLLFWDDSNSTYVQRFLDYKCRKGLILTTDLGLNIENLHNYDVVFSETKFIADKVRSHGIRSIKAFGTDDSFFNPYYSNRTPQKIRWNAFYPATFSKWKRQDVFSKKHRQRGLLLGTIQPDGWDILKECVGNRTQVMIGYFPVDYIRELYLMSEMVDITGYEGSGRTVLEAMSMDLPVEVSLDNYKCRSYIRELKASGLTPRKFILKEYSAKCYADNLMKGIAE